MGAPVVSAAALTGPRRISELRRWRDASADASPELLAVHCALRWLFILAVLVLFILGSPTAAGEQRVGSDATAKVRLTIALSRFVQWPEPGSLEEPEPLRLCVLHQSDFVGAAFSMMDGTSINGQRVIVHLNPRLGSPCELLFVDDSAARWAAAALVSVRDRPILTVGAYDGFLAAGGMIELVNVNDMLRFDVDLVSLRAARLSLRAGALKLARRVKS